MYTIFEILNNFFDNFININKIELDSTKIAFYCETKIIATPVQDQMLGACVTRLVVLRRPGVRRHSSVVRTTSCVLSSSGWRSGRSQFTVLLRDGGENLGRVNRRNTWSTFSGSDTSVTVRNFSNCIQDYPVNDNRRGFLLETKYSCVIVFGHFVDLVHL